MTLRNPVGADQPGKARMRGEQENAQYGSFSEEQVLAATADIAEQFKKMDPAASERRLTGSEFGRLVFTLSQIPLAKGENSHIVDLGATIMWVPLYIRLLGYRKVTIIRRGAVELLEKYDFSSLPDATVEGCNAELDLEKYDVSDRSVDCVVCFEVLEHLFGDPMYLMAETNRILKPDGYLVMSTPNILYRRNMLEIFRGAHPFGWSKFTLCYGDRHNREWTPFELEKLFSIAGFSDPDVFTADMPGEKKHLGAKFMVFGIFVNVLCYISSIFFSVPMKYRNNLVFARGKKTGEIKERYPSQFYDMFGRTEMIYPMFSK